MNTTADLVRTHYEPAQGGEGLLAQVAKALDALDGPITAIRLAGLDQFHARGLDATAELAELLGLRPDSEALDAGSGLGGPSRFLADTSGCRITGVDLVPAYVAIATLLAERTGLSSRVRYEVGDLTALPFPDGRFDAVFTQHVVMNVSDRSRVYREVRRVLKPSGSFAFYDVLSTGAGPEPIYPLPWAQSSATSVLLDEGETRSVLEGSGLMPEIWRDVTAEAIEWFAQARPPSPMGLTLATVMGPRFAEMAANLARNLGEGRLRLVMGRCTAR